MRNNLELYGEAAEIIEREFGEFLYPEDVEAGSRARRAITNKLNKFK